MLSTEQIDHAQEFHFGVCTRVFGKRGGETVKIERWRRNGNTKRWKRDTTRFYLPLKHGLRDTTAISQYSDLSQWHASESCPIASTPITISNG